MSYKKKKKRLGRGNASKGNTGGRGNKGQKSRSGYSSKLFEGGQTPLYKTVPKFGMGKKNNRGFKREKSLLRNSYLYSSFFKKKKLFLNYVR
ncbi:hypothetical protein [Candidatus Vidania fulgoroideorum]